MKNAYLIGQKIYLRPVERSDAPQFQRWINDPEVSRTLMGRLPLSMQAEEAFLDSIAKSEHDVVLGIVVKETDRHIGAVGLHNIDYRSSHASFGLLIGEPEEWGKGYGTEATKLIVRFAFDTLNLNRVWLHVYEINPAAARVYEKVGFKKEGVLRQHCFREGRYWDTITMGILREEWAR